MVKTNLVKQVNETTKLNPEEAELYPKLNFVNLLEEHLRGVLGIDDVLTKPVYVRTIDHNNGLLGNVDIKFL